MIKLGKLGKAQHHVLHFFLSERQKTQNWSLLSMTKQKRYVAVWMAKKPHFGDLMWISREAGSHWWLRCEEWQLEEETTRPICRDPFEDVSLWSNPPLSNSQHQDYDILSRELFENLHLRLAFWVGGRSNVSPIENHRGNSANSQNSWDP